MTLHFTFIYNDKKINQFLNVRRTTCKSLAYHKWYTYHSLGNAWLVQSSGIAFQSIATALDVLQWLTKHCLCESTPYLFLCLKLYLIVAVSIASCERSFSKLNSIKSYLRLTMGESRLSALVILSIESDFLEMLS